MNGSVFVVDAGFLPTTRQMGMAVALNLSRYVTPLWIRRDSRLRRVPRFGPELARRALPDELRNKVRSIGTGPEATRLLLERMGIRHFNYGLIWKRNRRVDRQAAELLRDEGLVIGQYGASAETFARASVLHASTILDYPIANLEVSQAILAEEAGRRPDFADSILGPGALIPRREDLARIAEEIRTADVILVGSKFAADSFEGVVPSERLRVVPYGCDTSRFTPATYGGENRRRIRILFAGQASQRKGIGYLLDAMRLVGTERFSLTVAGPVVGSGQGLSQYRGLYDHLGTVAPQGMPELYRGADVLLLPSLVEGSAVVVYEAMAAGLPVVVTPNVGADLVQDGKEGFIVPIRDPEAIADRLERLARYPAERARMGAAARARASQFDWTMFRRRFRETLDSMDSRSHSTAATSLSRC